MADSEKKLEEREFIVLYKILQEIASAIENIGHDFEEEKMDPNTGTNLRQVAGSIRRLSGEYVDAAQKLDVQKHG